MDTLLCARMEKDHVSRISGSRLHGSTSYRVPWLFDEEACDVARFFVNLKCRMMPYLYRMAVYSHETGIPMMRPMILEFPQEMGVKDLDMQYMLGDSILVAPIFREDSMGEFYLPEGTWTHLLSGERREGGRWYTQTYDHPQYHPSVMVHGMPGVAIQTELEVNYTDKGVI